MQVLLKAMAVFWRGARCSFAPVETHCSEGFVLDSWYLNFLVPFSEKNMSHRVNTYYAAVVQRRSRHEEKEKRVDSTSPFFEVSTGNLYTALILLYNCSFCRCKQRLIKAPGDT